MLTKEELGNIIMSDAEYVYKFDVTTGIVDEDIVDKHGYNYTAAAGLTSPFSFDEIIRRSFDTDMLDMKFTVESTTSELSCAAFLSAFAAGSHCIEATIFYPARNIYNRLSYILKNDGASGHIFAYVICRDVTEIEIYRLSHTISAQRQLEESDSIMASAGVGSWKIVLFEGEQPRMYANRVMMGLLGITDEGLSGEEIYSIWHSGIKSSSLPIVEDGVNNLIKLGKGEITYAWSHPKNGEIFVRCGGTSQHIAGKGFILSGYHRDVTDLTIAETRQKQRLADALEETRNQKRMLQQALDNFKQADYDRRTDFLTGLHSRQDMFEMLNDPLSEMREMITAVYMMDIDNFKLLNDHYGHSAGDDCLRAIGGALSDYGRKHNMLFYRYGGEELLGVSFDKSRPCGEVAEDIVGLIYGLNIQRSDVETGRVTISLGYTDDTGNFDRMIGMADKAMYHAKDLGKNRAFSFRNALE